jgi:YVTN family beta-propeller protein
VVTAYVVNRGSNAMTPISTATNTALKAIKVGRAPGAIAITLDGNTAYVANYYGPSSCRGMVTAINTATNVAGKAITVGYGAPAIAITQGGTTTYVLNGHSGTVTPVSTATDAALQAIKVGDNPVAIAMTGMAAGG